MMSALTSTARRAVVVSVEKKGLPVPPPKMAILPSAMAFRASLRVKAGATCGMVMEVNTSVSTPSCSSLSETASAFITVASIPILSARVRSILPLERPRQKLPPPTTMPICTPRSWAFFTPPQIASMVGSSKPVPFSPPRASPLIFRRIR